MSRTLGASLKEFSHRLQPGESPRLDAELLLAHVLGCQRIELFLKDRDPLEDHLFAKCLALIEQRRKGVPIAYLIGKKEFFGLDFYVEPGVLVPRPESETLIEAALEKAGKGVLRILDLGMGTGCLGLALLKEYSDSRLVGVDVSPVAVRVAQKNSESLGFSGRALFLEGDVGSASWRQDAIGFLGHEADIIVSNPPYVGIQDKELQWNVRKHEPDVALFGGSDGLDRIRVWTQEAWRLLRPGGWFFMEFGHRQARQVESLFCELGVYENIQIREDLSGRPRVLMASRRLSG